MSGVDQGIGHDGLPGGVQGVGFACVAQGIEGLGASQCGIAARLHVGGPIGVLWVSFYKAVDLMIYSFKTIYFLMTYVF
ncbi:hypothetical protein BER93_10820 [Xanthomonas fragariae]|nr:hypothetical protein BER92_10800 [Xanthomonas fragariae]AOD18541.1 hypothetical protein BER93_10820 [Xanthomonas fragariae]